MGEEGLMSRDSSHFPNESTEIFAPLQKYLLLYMGVVVTL